MIKLIGIDLDGTLLYPKRHLTVLIRKNTNFLKRFIAKGGKVIFVSGRNPMMQKKVEKKVGAQIPILCCNGSFLYKDGKVSNNSPIPTNTAIELYSKMKKKFGILAWVLLDSTSHMYTTFHNIGGFLSTLIKFVNFISLQYREHITYGEKEFVKALKNGENYKIMPVFGLGKKGKNSAEQAYTAIKDLFGDQVSVFLSDSAIEISALNTSKGIGLKKYAEENNIDLDEIAVIGDSGNDISMFEITKNSFAMSHAPKFVKEKANYIIDRVYNMEEYIDKL